MYMFHSAKMVYATELNFLWTLVGKHRLKEGCDTVTFCRFRLLSKSTQNDYNIASKVLLLSVVTPTCPTVSFPISLSLSASRSPFIWLVWYARAAAELWVALSPGKNKVINVRRHGALMDRPINGGKNLAQGLMQMEARPVTSGVNMRTRSMGRG